MDISILDKSVMLGIIREQVPLGTLIHPTLAPLEDVATTRAIVDIILEAGATLAPYRAPGAEAELRGRDKFDQAIVTLADIAIKEEFKEEDLRILRIPGELPVERNSFIRQQRKFAENEIRKALARCRRDVDYRMEWATLNALLGEIAYSGRIKFTLDTQVPAGHKDQAPDTLWDADGAIPLDDIIDWCETVDDASGVVPKRLLLTNRVLVRASRNSSFRDAVGNIGKVHFGATEVVAAIKAYTPIEEVIVYDAKYLTRTQDLEGVDSTSTTRFLAQGKIMLLPADGDVEDGLIRNLTAPAVQSDWETGYYPINVDHLKEDPPQIEVGAGINAIPFLRHPKTVFNADVLSP